MKTNCIILLVVLALLCMRKGISPVRDIALICSIVVGLVSTAFADNPKLPEPVGLPVPFRRYGNTGPIFSPPIVQREFLLIKMRLVFMKQQLMLGRMSLFSLLALDWVVSYSSGAVQRIILKVKYGRQSLQFARKIVYPLLCPKRQPMAYFLFGAATTKVGQDQCG